MTEEQSGLIIASLTEYFRETVSDTLREQSIDTSEETEFYLVNLLATFSKTDRLYDSEDGEEPLALMLRRALESRSPDASIPVYRRIGDVSLYKSGFFNRSLRNEAVSQSYYVEMGRGAYEALSSLMKSKRDRVFADIFEELARKFAAFVEVFIQIAEQHNFGANNAPIDLLERWAEVHSSQAGARLVRSGYLPVWQFDLDESETDGDNN